MNTRNNVPTPTVHFNVLAFPCPAFYLHYTSCNLLLASALLWAIKYYATGNRTSPLPPTVAAGPATCDTFCG